MAVVLPRVFSLAVSAELAVVKLVHRAAVTVEDSEETEDSLVDGDTFGLIGKVRLHVDGTNFDPLLQKLEHVREYLAENLIQSLMQGVLHCAYYVFTRQRFDGDYDTLLAGGRISGEDWRDYQAFVYHELQALQVALCGQDKLTNMFSRCSLLGHLLGAGHFCHSGLLPHPPPHHRLHQPLSQDGQDARPEGVLLTKVPETDQLPLLPLEPKVRGAHLQDSLVHGEPGQAGDCESEQ